MEIKGFTDTKNIVETPNDDITTEKPLKEKIPKIEFLNPTMEKTIYIGSARTIKGNIYISKIDRENIDRPLNFRRATA